MMTKLFFIALGGSLGAPLRYLINDSMKDFYFFMLPSGIMLVNFKSNAYYLLIVGFLGSFTTMSAFSQQTIELLYNGKELNALIYVLASIITCLIGTFLAFYLFKTS